MSYFKTYLTKNYSKEVKQQLSGTWDWIILHWIRFNCFWMVKTQGCYTAAHPYHTSSSNELISPLTLRNQTWTSMESTQPLAKSDSQPYCVCSRTWVLVLCTMTFCRWRTTSATVTKSTSKICEEFFSANETANLWSWQIATKRKYSKPFQARKNSCSISSRKSAVMVSQKSMLRSNF